MNINDIYKNNGDFIKADDLQGKTVRLTISEVGTHDFAKAGEKEDLKIALSFEGKEKRLTLNITNAKIISKEHGDDTDGWVGKQIKIYPTTTDFGDQKDVPCIRVLAPMPEESADVDL